MSNRLFALALVCCSIGLRLLAFAQTPFANGWDSYFYLVQIKAWIETGRMHSPEASLIYPFMRTIYWFTGDYVWMYKAGAALLAGAWTALVMWVAHQWVVADRALAHKQGDQHLFQTYVPFVLGAWTVFSPQLTYFAAQYPKNLLGGVLFLGFVGALSAVSFKKTVEDLRPTVVQWALPVTLLIVNYFGHRFTFGLALVYGLFWGFTQTRNAARTLLFKAPPVRQERSKALWRYSPALLLLFLVGCLWVTAVRLPGLFRFVDLDRIQGISLQPHFTPWLFVQQFGEGERISMEWLFEIGFAVLLLVGVLFMLVAKKGFRDWAAGQTFVFPLLLLSGVLLFPFLDWSFTGVSYRFLLFFLLISPLLSVPLMLYFWKGNGLFLKKTAVAVAFLCIIGGAFAWKSYSPIKHDPDYALFQKVTDVAVHYFDGKPPELVIAHNALAELFTFSTNIDAMPWLPEYAIDTPKLWRIAANVRMPELQYFWKKEPGNLMFRLPGNYALLREDVWQIILATARAEEDDEFVLRATSWQNPNKMRPTFLLERKKTH